MDTFMYILVLLIAIVCGLNAVVSGALLGLCFRDGDNREAIFRGFMAILWLVCAGFELRLLWT